MPTISAILASNINKTQTDNFYFTVLFVPDTGTIDASSFTLTNVQISGTTDFTVTDDFSLLYVTGNFAVIAVDLPDNVEGDFILNLTGTVSISGTSHDISAPNKFIAYDTIGSRAGETYNTNETPQAITEVEVTSSTRSVKNGGIVIVQFNFDYGFQNFDTAAKGARVFTVPAGFTKSDAEAIDDNFRRWILLVTVPATGSGTDVEMTVAADAFGFDHSAITLEISHSADPLLIVDESRDGQGNPTIQPIKGMQFERVFTITGNNVGLIDVVGELIGFHHDWDPTTGRLFVRSLGKVDDDYDDFEFSIIAGDDGGVDSSNMPRTVEHDTFLTSPVPLAPAIIVPSEPLVFVYGEMNEQEIEIRRIETVSANNLYVGGTWIGLKYKKSADGVEIFGDVPNRGSKMGQFLPGRSSGEFEVRASGPGGAAVPADVPWVLVGRAKPVFRDRAFTGVQVLNMGLDDTIIIDGYPAPTVVVESGALPTGVALEVEETSETVTTVSFTGNASATGTFTFKLKATNAEGVTISSDYTVNVYSGLVAPSIRLRISPNLWLPVSRFPWNANLFFNRGTPPGTYSLSTGTTSYLQISADGILTVVGTPPASSTRYDLEIILTNSEGSVSQSSRIRF